MEGAQMNNERRKKIKEVVKLMERSVKILQEVEFEETTALDNLPDSLRDGEKGDKMEEAIQTIEDAMSDISSYMLDLKKL